MSNANEAGPQASATLSIVRVVSVVDTREYVEEGDRWVPVPGSGVEHECTRCGRLHEVHATVELSDGSTAVVGTGCAKGESADIVRALTNGANAAKRTKILEREVARERALCAAWDAKAAEFDALPRPTIVESYTVSSDSERGWGAGRGRLILNVGQTQVWCGDYPSLDAMPREEREERLRCLWGSLQHDYCGGSRRGHYLRAAEDALAKHLRRIEAKGGAS